MISCTSCFCRIWQGSSGTILFCVCGLFVCLFSFLFSFFCYFWTCYWFYTTSFWHVCIIWVESGDNHLSVCSQNGKKLIFRLRKQNCWCRNLASTMADLKEEILNFPSCQNVKNILWNFLTASYYFHIYGQLHSQSFSSAVQLRPVGVGTTNPQPTKPCACLHLSLSALCHCHHICVPWMQPKLHCLHQSFRSF